MLTIWKVPLDISKVNEMQEISLLAPGVLLRFRNQREVPTLWFLVDDKGPIVVKTVILVETGADVNKACFTQEEIDKMGGDPTAHGFITSFAGTAVFHNGYYVLHLFDRTDLTHILTPPPSGSIN